MKLQIQEAKPQDERAVEAVCLAAFPDTENQTIAVLAGRLLSETGGRPTISLIAQASAGVVGYMALSPLDAHNLEAFNSYLLGPLAVLPESQGTGVGGELIEYGCQLLGRTGVEAVFVYGDPGYYSRFGFRADAATQFVPPYELTYPFGWQVRFIQQSSRKTQELRLSCVEPFRDPALW